MPIYMCPIKTKQNNNSNDNKVTITVNVRLVAHAQLAKHVWLDKMRSVNSHVYEKVIRTVLSGSPAVGEQS